MKLNGEPDRTTNQAVITTLYRTGSPWISPTFSIVFLMRLWKRSKNNIRMRCDIFFRDNLWGCIESLLVGEKGRGFV